MFIVTLDPIIFQFGHLALRWYSLILLTATTVGVWLTAKEAARRGFREDDVYDAALWILGGGLVGARLFHVLDHWSDIFAANPIRVLYIWEGGLALVAYAVARAVLDVKPHQYHWAAPLIGGLVGVPLGWLWFAWRGDVF